MQRITLYIIILVAFLAGFTPINGEITGISKIKSISVRIFSCEKNQKIIFLKSNCTLLPLEKPVNRKKNYTITAENGLLNLINESEKVTLPKTIELKTYDNVPICLKTATSKSRCYKGTIKITNKENQLELTSIVPIKEYLYSVVSSEIPANWPNEAVKAQAIASYTYVLYLLNNNKTIQDSTNNQFYGGSIFVNPSFKKPIDKVNHIIILDQNKKPIEALFHSTCAGHTNNNESVFRGPPRDYLRGRPCFYCKESNFYKSKTYKISLSELKQVFYSPYLQFIMGKDNLLKQVKSNNGVFSAYESWLKLGQQLGWGAVPGVKFTIKCKENLCTIVSRGAGHSVGLCQWGARGMALKGFQYQQILRYYYKNIMLYNVSKKEFID